MHEKEQKELLHQKWLARYSQVEGEYRHGLELTMLYHLPWAGDLKILLLHLGNMGTQIIILAFCLPLRGLRRQCKHVMSCFV